MKKIFGSVGVLFVSLASFAQEVARPKLVVGIVVDQMRWDYLYRFYDRYEDGGLKRLLNKGFSCEQAFINYLPSYTAPGHTTIYSGAVPAMHGIVGNEWIDRVSALTVYCAADPGVNSIGGSQSAGKMSPRNMKSSTVGDELRLATNFSSRVFGVALKDRGAIFPAGHTANAAFWFDDSTGNFISSSYYLAQLPGWLQQFNAKRWPDTFCAKNWETLYPISSYRQSTADDNRYEELRKGEFAPVFPHITAKDNYKSIRSLPAGNTLTFKMAKALIKGEALGMQGSTDMLTVSLSSTDYIGHAYAPNAIETEDTYLRLDRDIASFLNFLDNTVGQGNYLLFLSADHGAAHNVSLLQDHKIPSGILSEYDMKKELNGQLHKHLGYDSLIRAVMNYQVFLNEPLIREKKINRVKLKETVRELCSAYKGMSAVLDLEMFADATFPLFLKEKISNGYYPGRCGTLALVYEPAWYSDGPKGTTHGTWNPYDTHIPLVWYGWRIPAGTSYSKVNMTDIAVTLSAMLHIQMPNAANGSVIDFSSK